jgi:DNA ligase-1
VLLDELVSTSAEVAGTGARRAKIEAIAGLLSRVPPAEVPVAVAFLSGDLRQRQIGVGYASLSGPQVSPPAGTASLTLAGTDATFAGIGVVTGPGSQATRRALLGDLFAQATERERGFLSRLLSGELRQGAQEGVMTEAIARAAGVPADLVRRAHQLGGSLPEVAQAALGPADPDGAAAALRAVKLRVGRPIRPMLAASAPDVAAALAKVSPAAVEWKIDGIRIQVHRHGDDVTVWTRTLDDITTRVPEITSAVRALGVTGVVLDGEAVALFPDGRPRPFQVTASRAATRAAGDDAGVPLTPFFFDLLHADGADLIDEPGEDRFARLASIAPPSLVIPRIVTASLDEAQAFFAAAVARGHEGVVIKSLGNRYAAGRRGSEWIKVKPRHTLDLVILAAEWGHGRRRGWLSNLHLGARDPETGGTVMLGKTFKGLTDEMLTWQTSRLLDLADPPLASREPPASWGVVKVRPELVVEIAFDGVQGSPRYPGGVALRFARVLRYREDKTAAEADTIGAVRALWDGRDEEDGSEP